MKYVTIEQWIAKNSEHMTHAQVLTKDGDSFKVKSQVMDLEELTEYYNQRSPEDVFEYSIKEDGYIVSDVTTARVRFSDNLDIIKRAFYMVPLENSIYHLFNRLIDDNAYLVAPEGLDDLDNIENNIIEFIPKYSLSTMSVYIPIPVNFYWKSIRLLYAEGNELKSNDFYFRVPKSVSDKYNYEVVATFNLGKRGYVVMHYNNENPIYVYDPSKIRIYESMLNKYTYMSKELKNYMNVVSLIKREYCKEKLTVEYKNSKKINSMKVFNSNVSFESTASDVTSNEIHKLIDDIDNNLVSLIKTAKDRSEVQRHISRITSGSIAYSIYYLLVDMYKKTNGYTDITATFEMCNEALEEYGKKKAKIDAFIYAFRVNCFSFSVPVMVNGYTFSGGGVPAKTRFRRLLDRDF